MQSDRYSKRLVYTSDANAADRSFEEEFEEEEFDGMILKEPEI
mgnify:CR=1 FL=1